MAKAAEKVYALIQSTVEAQGVSLWDVRYVKEGASYYLRVYIDKEDGISIDDCTEVSHAIDPLLDEADPIEGSYYLEVCSPGLERELTRPWHFESMQGRTVKVRLYRALDGVKEFTGVLKSGSPDVVLTVDGQDRRFSQKEISKANLCDDSLTN